MSTHVLECPENPVEVIKRDSSISPFWEEDLGALAELIGVDHVLFGSDFPHPEDLAPLLDVEHKVLR